VFITLSIPKLIKENPYETAKVEKIFAPSVFNVAEWYGGKIKSVAKLKESSLYLLVDYNMKTIDTAIDTTELDNLSSTYMREILKKYGLTYNATMGRDQILEKFKEYFQNK
jgi:hypothetical protein